ncbi:MAG: ABC-type oligopeptide transport system substrate-binding subunit, partial [Glaciecola sp.]
MSVRRLAASLAVTLAASACSLQLPGTEPRISPDAVVGAESGGTLRVGLVRPAGVDPLDAYEPGAQLISSLVCEPLVNVDPVTGELKAGLAKKVQVAGDGTTVTIELPRDLATHDGGRLQADDLLTSFSRLASPANASRVRSLLQPVQGYDEVAGDLLAKGEERLTGVVALNDLSVQIMLTLKDPGFLARLAHPALAPVSSDAVALDPRGFRDKPVCAGPYKMVDSFDPSARTLTIERFQEYGGTNPNFTAGGRGYADKIQFHFFGDFAAARRSWDAKRVDVLSVPGSQVGLF